MHTSVKSGTLVKTDTLVITGIPVQIGTLVNTYKPF